VSGGSIPTDDCLPITDHLLFGKPGASKKEIGGELFVSSYPNERKSNVTIAYFAAGFLGAVFFAVDFFAGAFFATFFAGAFFAAGFLAAAFLAAGFAVDFFAGISYPPFHSAVAEDKETESQFA
jgi:hypothetical protein